MPKLERSGACGIHITTLKDGKAAHFRAECGCWKCQHCVETRLRPRLLANILQRAKTQGKLFYGTCHTSEWRRVYRHLRGGYVWLRNGTTIHIFAGKPTDGLNRLSGKALETKLKRLVRELPYGVCPFFFCRKWTPARDKTRKGNVIVCKSHIPVSAIQQAAIQLDIRHKAYGEACCLKADITQIIAVLERARQIARTIYPKNHSSTSYDSSRRNSPAVLAPATELSL